MNNQVKLIDRNKILDNLMECIDTFKDDLGYAIKEGDEDHVNEISNKIELLQLFVDGIMSGSYKPDVPTIKPGDKVTHIERGIGTVLWVLSDHASVQFNDVIKICKIRDLEVVE